MKFNESFAKNYFGKFREIQYSIFSFKYGKNFEIALHSPPMLQNVAFVLRY